MTKPYPAPQSSARPLTTASGKDDIYARVTAKILSDLEQGDLTWRKPWHADHMSAQVMRPLRWNNIPYTGINTLMLWATAAEKGYSSTYWMTFNQALELNASVLKGEKGTQVVYADTFTREDENAQGETQTQKIPFLKTYTVFNADQIDGLSPSYFPKAEAVVPDPAESRQQELETFFAETKADIYTGTQATYTQVTDRIQMPPFESFETPMRYYSVLAHELTHWTKHPKRLDRDLGRKTYGDEGYAKEELVVRRVGAMKGVKLK